MQTIWILGDVLSLKNSALAQGNRKDAIVLLIEAKTSCPDLRYHQLKLVLIYSAMRHFARDLRKRGWTVDYHELRETPTFEAGLRRHVEKYGPVEFVMEEPASFPETELAQNLARRMKIPLRTTPASQFLLTREEFQAWAKGQKRLLMETHYRRTRKRFGWLVDKKGEPEGGAWNFDPENRATFRTWEQVGKPGSGLELSEKPDAITRKVMEMVAREFPKNPGHAADFWLPVDRAGALRWLRHFIDDCLPSFGAFEDMMAESEPFLLHSVLSPLINIGLLHPRECIEAAIDAFHRGAAPINSVEGYVRQLAGWREFVNGVYWVRGAEYKELNVLGADQPLPEWFYTGQTEMNCLHRVLRQNLRLGWNHHIQRLMILGNFFLIAGIRPREALRWFNEMFVDAFDWVMAANVIGMALHADGGYMATKPYAATSTYINKMSDYCRGCRFDPAKKTGPEACPFNYLYWNFMDQHADRFRKNPRMSTIVGGWLRRTEADKERVRDSAATFLEQI